MKELQRKDFTFGVKAMDDAAGTVTLYAAVFNNVDRQDEVILPGAFMNLPAFVQDGWLAFSHNWGALAVATIESATQDEKGLLLECKWHSTPDAQACRTVVKERKDRGKPVKCSISYEVVDSTLEDRGGERVRVLKSIVIYEASIVNLPANPLAEVQAVKQMPRVADLARAVELFKSGRALSNANRKRLTSHAVAMESVCKDIRALLDETDPDLDPDLEPAEEPAEPEETGKAAFLNTLRLRAVRGRALALSPTG